MSNEALIDGFKKIVTEAIEALEQSQQLISAAEDIGYREACESIGNGVSFLFNALSIDGDDYGQDTAEAESLSEALKRIARGLEPMGITPNDDDGDLQLPIKALEQSEWVRCDERDPDKKGESYLGAHKVDGDWITYEVWFSATGKWVDIMDGGKAVNTHWKPITPPPAEVET